VPNLLRRTRQGAGDKTGGATSTPASANDLTCKTVAKRLRWRTGAAMAFQFVATNLVLELGVLMWVLISWQFAAAEFIGGHPATARTRIRVGASENAE
jgi:hypothetical protein